VLRIVSGDRGVYTEPVSRRGWTLGIASVVLDDVVHTVAEPATVDGRALDVAPVDIERGISGGGRAARVRRRG